MFPEGHSKLVETDMTHARSKDAISTVSLCE